MAHRVQTLAFPFPFMRRTHCRIDIELFAAVLALTFSTTISPGCDIYAAQNGLSQITNRALCEFRHQRHVWWNQTLAMHLNIGDH